MTYPVRVTGTPLQTQTYEGAPGGMNLFLPAQELDDTEVRYAQDILFDIPGELRMRGPMAAISGVASVSKPGTGLVQTLDPNGASRFAVLYGDNSNGNFAAISADLTTATDLPWNGVLPTNPGASQPYRMVDCKSSLFGGSLVGSSSAYDSNSPVQTLAFWKGGNKVDYTTGTVATLARGGTAVVGSGTAWLTNAVAGMFLFGSTDDGYSNTLIGVVQSVNSDTSITLVDPSPYPMTAKAYKLTSLRGFQKRVGAGRITTATTSTAVNGGATKFSAQKLSTGSWNIYRASDWAWVGKVASVTSDIQLTLTANAAVACNNEHYIALRADGDWSINTMAVANEKMGFLNTTYAECQWYANNGQKFLYTSRVWFSDPADPELVDLSSADGNFIDIGSSTGANTPIKALIPTFNALVVLKDNEAYGVFGSSVDSFNVKKISDDGVINGMSAQPYAGGAIWAGRNGIYFYDGNQANNMTAEKLGQSYKAWIKSFDSTRYRIWSMVAKNHYFLFMEQFVTDTAVVKGNVSHSPTAMTIVINMDTGAVTTLTNVNIRGSIVLPAATGQTTWFLANSATAGFICDSATLFEQTGRDVLTCDGGTPGPDPFVESKKFNEGDSMRKKLFKQIALDYLAQGGALKIDTVVGLNNVGATSATQLPATVLSWDQLAASIGTWDSLGLTYSTWDALINAQFTPRRVKFLKRSQHFAFRIYAADTNLTKMVIGPFQLGWKDQRAGRI